MSRGPLLASPPRQNSMSDVAERCTIDKADPDTCPYRNQIRTY